MTLSLYKRGDFYNPLFLDTDKGGFELRNILFYSKEEVVVETNCGWFVDETGHHIGPINLDGVSVAELKIKRKPDLSLDKPFLVHVGKESHERASDRRFPELKYKHGNLYIPFVRQDWMIEEQTRENPLSAEYHKKYVHKDGYCLTKHSKTEELKGNIEFYNKVSEIPEVLGLSMDISEFHVFEQTPDGIYVKNKKLIGKLKDIVNSL